MILIADAGSTKTCWCLVDGGVRDMMRSPGINAATMSPETVTATINDVVLPWLAGRHVDTIYYYGAGVVGECQRRIVAGALGHARASRVVVESDMLGASRSILGREAGIACILGTGSNTCLYDGAYIVDNVPSLGYILGDEGSGASLGRRFVGDLFKRLLPAEAMDIWHSQVGLDLAGVITQVYRKPGANVFLASLVPMIRGLMSVPEVALMVEDEFDRFFERNIERYDTDCRRLGFVGSVAAHFGSELERVAVRRGYAIASVSADPMDGLVRYHSQL